MPTPSPWWRNAVVYEIYVRSFADGNGDGVGDLPGVTARLDHIADLGADAVWLTPFYRSPMADAGYDVADPRDVDPLFGTLADFDALLARAHDLGLRVIIDMVPNHTSAQHRWFQEALAAPPGSPARARYVFRDGRDGGALPPTDWQSVFGGPAWERVPDGQWYLHLFAPEQPDLDWSHPEVAAEFHDTLRFWLDRGVDGFRFDVAHGMAKDLTEPLRDLGPHQVHHSIVGDGWEGGHPFWDREEVHGLLRGFRETVDAYAPARVTVAESWAALERRSLYTRPDELHQAFNFDFLTAAWDPAALRATIDRSLALARSTGAAPTWVLSNHDVIRHASRLQLPRAPTRKPGSSPGAPSRSSTPGRPCAGPAPPRSCSSPCRAPPTSTKVRNWACPRWRTCPTMCCATRCAAAPGEGARAATGAGCRFPGARKPPRTASGRPNRGCPNRARSARCPPRPSEPTGTASSTSTARPCVSAAPFRPTPNSCGTPARAPWISRWAHCAVCSTPATNRSPCPRRPLPSW
ncbi:hypothetical protein SSPO_005090 [Streptomyces antimycoticus]|uniref:Glycosyl hydrolase family 13 catalytic domain-containing protein n=1 Tax=Streptomyces antimycoticus TaxID=68175 RepID=A0A499UKW1_9ACTN|nr:hypothetical protein SSPO_005090 [Streptomyces antimycoticus]